MKIKIPFKLGACIFILYITNAVAQEFSEHTIASNYNSWSTMAIDMDNDNDIDIVGSARFGSKVSWWENDGSESFTEQVISTSAWYAMGVSAADMDNDDDIDVVCAAQEADAVLWWENDGMQGFTQHVASNIVSPSFIYLADVDSDEDQDILVAACEDGSNKIVWLENIGSTEFTFHIIKENWINANSVFVSDLDSDNDMDVLATASFRLDPQNGEISWFENDGNQNFTEHNIINNYGRPSCAIAADIDNDDDIDIIASVCVLHRILLFENDGAQNFTSNIIATNFLRPHNLCTADIDNDSDLDILGTSINLDQIAWFENENSVFTKHVVSNNFDGATCVYAEDIDNDGDQDILGAAQFGNQIKWWESDLITGFESSPAYYPEQFSKLKNYPNPFSHSTTITYTIQEKSDVVLKIYNSTGEEVALLLYEYQLPGNKFVVWEGTDNLGDKSMPGLYYCILTTEGEIISHKLIKYN